MFAWANTITNINIRDWNTPKAENMSMMFAGLRSLTTLNVNKWNTISVQQLNGTFWDTNISEIEVSNWDTSRVVNFYGTFHGLWNLTDIDIYKLNFASANSTEKLFY